MIKQGYFRVAYLPCLVMLSTLNANSAFGLEDNMLAALDLADNTVFEAAQEKTLTTIAEVAGIINDTGRNIQRVSLDMRWDTPLKGSFSNKWRFVLSNRIDSRFYGALSKNDNVNSLREAYLNYKISPNTLVDVGRVNTRYGVALGFNPTDFLGKNTVRSVISADPESLRNNRLGNAMIRFQHYWNNASLTAIISPKLGNQPNSDSASFDWGASNPKDRLLLVGSYKFAENFNPQVFYLQESQSSPQVGLNLSRVLSRSTLMYAEWAGGRQPLAWQNTLPKAYQNIRWRNRTAAGITWSSEKDLTLRLEGHYNGSADNKLALSTLSQMQPASMGNGQSFSQMQDWMAPKRSLLIQAYKKDIVDKYDLNLILQRDLQQQKNIGFAEVRRHIGPADVALQWQKTYHLDERNAFQVKPEQRWQLSVNYYF